jgi:hypothetical protein
MPRHRIPGDRFVKDDAGTEQTDRRIIEMSGSGFNITTPDANEHTIDVSAGGITLTPPDPIEVYEGKSIWMTKALSIPSAGTGFFDFSGVTINNEPSTGTLPLDTIGGFGLADGTIAFEQSGLYSISWYVEKDAEPAVDIWFQLLTSHSNILLGHGNDNWFTLDKMRGGASPLWAGRANVTDYFVGSNEDIDLSGCYLKYTSTGLAYPYTMSSSQLTITKIL